MRKSFRILTIVASIEMIMMWAAQRTAAGSRRSRSIALTNGELGEWILPPILPLRHAKTPPVSQDMAMVYWQLIYNRIYVWPANIGCKGGLVVAASALCTLVTDADVLTTSWDSQRTRNPRRHWRRSRYQTRACVNRSVRSRAWSRRLSIPL